MKNRLLVLLLVVVSLYPVLARGARTLVDIANDVFGICAVANGCTGTATAAAGTVFGRSTTAGTGAPSFVSYASVLGAIPTPNAGRWTLFQATGSGISLFGDSITVVASTTTDTAATTSLPAFHVYGSSAVNGNVASQVGKDDYVVGRNPYVQGNYGLVDNVTRRDWILTLTNQTAATMGASDDPAGNYVGFRASTAAPDSFYRCVSKDNATQENQSSTVALDAALHKFEIYESAAGTYDFFVDGVKRCTNVTHPPTSGTVLHLANTVTCVSCASGEKYNIAWEYIQTNF